MKLKERLKMLLGFRQKSPEERRTPDLIGAQYTVALQAHERASQRARDALQDLLDSSDKARGPRL